MSQSSFNKYEINQLPDDPSQITAGSVTDIAGLGVPSSGGLVTIHYQQVGKLYFGFNMWSAATGQVNMVLGPLSASTNPNSTGMNDNITRLCTLLGITENTRYVGYIYGSGSGRVIAAYNSGTPAWQEGNANETSFLLAILAN